MIHELITQIQEKKAPIVVGLDPKLEYIPEDILKNSFTAYGETLEGAADAIYRFNRGIVDAVAD